MKKIEIELVSKGVNDFLNGDGHSVFGRSDIRKTVYKGTLNNEVGDLRLLDIINITKGVTGIEPTYLPMEIQRTDSRHDIYEAEVNDRLTFIVRVER